MKCKDIQYSIFCNTEDKNNDNQFVKDLFNHFFDYGFIVSTIQLNSVQIDATKNQDAQSILSIVERPQLTKNSTNEIITILPDRIDYTIGARLLPNNTLEWTSIDKSKEGFRYLNEILGLLSKNASRLAMNVNYFVENKYTTTTNSSNTYYNSRKAVEKNSRILARESFSGEVLNVIHEINEFREGTIMNFNNLDYKLVGTHIHNDINTYQINMAERFNGDNLINIFNRFVELNSEIIGGLGYEE